jgi:phosphatidylglycerophosphate synthase
MLADTGRDLVARTLGPVAERIPNVHPNAITLAAFTVSIISGFAFYLTDRHPAFFLVTAGLAATYGFLDALDGLVARMHGKATPFGDFLDHALDRLSALIAFGGITLTSHCNDVLGLLIMLGMLYHGFLGTQMEASFGFRVYRGLGIAEAILINIVYSLTCFTILVTGLPFAYDLPILGSTVRLTVTDTFILLALPLIAVGTIQRFLIALDLGRQAAGSPRPVRAPEASAPEASG